MNSKSNEADYPERDDEAMLAITPTSAATLKANLERFKHVNGSVQGDNTSDPVTTTARRSTRKRPQTNSDEGNAQHELAPALSPQPKRQRL